MRWIGLLALLAVGGCFSYVPAQPEGPTQGSRVRVHLQGPAEYRLGDFTVHNIMVVDGEIVQWNQEQLVLSAWNLRSGLGQAYDAAGMTVEVPRQNLGLVEARRLSVARTALLVGAIGAAAVLVPQLLEGGGGGVRTPPPPQPN